MRSLPALSESDPCGPDLEYDPAFMALETLARGKAEQQFGETIVAAEPPNWKAVLDECDRLLSRTRDLRVAIFRARAMTQIEGLAGTAEGYALVSSLVSEFWPHVHPRLDPDDDNDPTIRVNALAGLLDPANALRELRSAVWFRTRGAQCTVRQALAGLGQGEPGSEPAISQAEMAAMIGSMTPEARVNSARDALQSIESMRERLNGYLTPDAAPDLKPLIGILKPLAEFFDRSSGVAVADQALPEDSPMAAAVPAAASNTASSGDLRSREDVVRSLERACQYLERHEPSHPAPLLIRRAQRLLNMSFIDIMKDMAPDALSAVENIAGTQHSNDSND